MIFPSDQTNVRNGKQYNELVIDRVMGSCYNSPDTRNGDGGHEKISSTVTCRKGDWLMKKNSATGRNWEEVERELFTPEEIAESDLRVALMTAIIQARLEKGITYKQLESMSGVKRGAITWMEHGEGNQKISTILKVLSVLGLTLKVTPIIQNSSLV